VIDPDALGTNFLLLMRAVTLYRSKAMSGARLRDSHERKRHTHRITIANGQPIKGRTLHSEQASVVQRTALSREQRTGTNGLDGAAVPQ